MAVKYQWLTVKGQTMDQFWTCFSLTSQTVSLLETTEANMDSLQSESQEQLVSPSLQTIEQPAKKKTKRWKKLTQKMKMKTTHLLPMRTSAVSDSTLTETAWKTTCIICHAGLVPMKSYIFVCMSYHVLCMT